MKVIIADVLGMCFGVRDALRAIEAIDRPRDVTIHGELVHNEMVLTQLESRGFGMTRESDRGGLPATPRVLITAHGISDVERSRLESAGKGLLDTTCPLVTRAHRAAQALQRSGYHVVVIGRRGHVEVRGIVGDLDHFEIVQDVEDVTRFPSNRLGIVCQTTMPERKVRLIRESIQEQNPGAEVRFVDTVCRPTKDHQRSLERLIDQVDAIVVIGGRNSNNTRELVALCAERGRRALHVQSAQDLDPTWFSDCEIVGVTAGTSTLDTTIDEVRRALLEMEPCAIS